MVIVPGGAERKNQKTAKIKTRPVNRKLVTAAARLSPKVSVSGVRNRANQALRSASIGDYCIPSQIQSPSSLRRNHAVGSAARPNPTAIELRQRAINPRELS